MRFFATAVAAAGALAAAGAVTAATATADAGDAAPSTHPIGSQGTVKNGDVIQGWTVSDLRPSSDAIPYQPQGTLWEATATGVAIQGTVTPVVANLGARSSSGLTYPALFTVATAQGVNPANLTQGQKTSGKVYFDVTGDAPNSAVYQGAGQDLLVWIPAAPSGDASGNPATGAHRTTGPAATGAKPAQQGTPGAGTATDATAAGSEGTPLSAGSEGTPLAAEADGTAASGSQTEAGTASTGAQAEGTGTAEASTSAGTPAPSSQQAPATPAPSEAAAAAGSSGTPLPTDASGASTTEATGTASSEGTAGGSDSSGGASGSSAAR
ncbi:hypothetical protein AWC02_10175 [Mycolicibacter engbaekii]|uniref:MPT63-like domain-containing protein n=1 Tax=Mycolicibacter engbaekii TaxID=188915 RepID=A0A1X1TR61_9MYCO|nr:MPT63 family protein [Mycolicibacter engbaekii]ORV47054.1 hypothetical protein AWC02_10175 [Mycolicibacter engbaekii]